MLKHIQLPTSKDGESAKKPNKTKQLTFLSTPLQTQPPRDFVKQSRLLKFSSVLIINKQTSTMDHCCEPIPLVDEKHGNMEQKKRHFVSHLRYHGETGRLKKVETISSSTRGSYFPFQDTSILLKHMDYWEDRRPA